MQYYVNYLEYFVQSNLEIIRHRALQFLLCDSFVN